MTSMGPSLEQHGVMSQPFSQHISAPQLSFQGIDVEELGLMGAARRGHQRTARRTSLDGSNNHTTHHTVRCTNYPETACECTLKGIFTLLSAAFVLAVWRASDISCVGCIAGFRHQLCVPYACVLASPLLYLAPWPFVIMPLQHVVFVP